MSNVRKYSTLLLFVGMQWRSWLIHRPKSRKVAVSIPDDVKLEVFRPHYGPEVESASKRSEHLEYFVGVKTASA